MADDDRDQWNGPRHPNSEPVRLARAFYGKLLPEFGMKPVYDGAAFFYCVDARTAIGIESGDPALAGERFVQQRVGLHHLCLRARPREDVNRCADLLKEMEATIIRGPMDGPWAPGYYYVLFEDPDGIRLKVNFVPGVGVLGGSSVQPCHRLCLTPRPTQRIAQHLAGCGKNRSTERFVGFQ